MVDDSGIHASLTNSGGFSIILYTFVNHAEGFLIFDNLMNDNYIQILNKLHRFIRRFYINRIIRGFLYSLAIAVLLFLFILLLENYIWFGTQFRAVLFWGGIAILLAIFIGFIFIPLLKLFSLGNHLSDRDAASIIGKHFPEVDDLLLNTLELKEMMDRGDTNSDLVLASIEQKSLRLSPVPFHLAINFKSNIKYLRFVLPLVLLFVLIWWLKPSFVSDTSQRIIHYNQEYNKPVPFSFELINTDLVAIQNEDFTLQVKVIGEMLPEAVYVHISDQKYLLSRFTDDIFIYNFRNLASDQEFYLSGAEVNSEKYLIHVYPRPVLLDFEVNADYPNYTQIKNEVFANIGDLVVPEGTRLSWKYYTRDCEFIDLILADTVLHMESMASNVFNYHATISKNMVYKIVTGNDYLVNPDTMAFMIKSVRDRYPEISVTESRDSVLSKRLYFNGLIKDDYGFSQLQFFYKHMPAGDTNGVTWMEPVPIVKTVAQQSFFHFFDLETLMLLPGDKVSYYFQISDNDGIRGPKSTKTFQYVFEAPTMEEVDMLAQKNEDVLIDEMESAIKETHEIQKEIENLTRKMVEEQDVSWEQKDKLAELMERQENLENKMEDLMQKNQDMMSQENEYKDFNPEILEKQQQLEDLFRELMSDDMKEMYDEMQKLMEEMDKDKMSEMLNEMEMSSEELEEELDRTLELFKKLEVEKDLNDYIEKLKDLAEEQKKLSEETEKESGDELADNLEKQAELNEEFEKLMEEMDSLMEKNDELDEPFPLEDPSEDENSIQEDQQESMEQMKDSKPGEAGKSQSSAAGKMKKMSEEMMEMMAGMAMQQMAEDMNTLRQILENLIELSFMQEDLAENLKIMKRNDPLYIDLIRDQNNIKTDLVGVKDSLVALGKRQMAIKPYITEKINDLNHHVESAIVNLTEYRIGNSIKEQQYSMTAINDLALLLAEAMDQMNKEMQGMQGGGGGNSSCPKPGGQGEQSISNMRQLQEQLSKQLESMKEGMKPGGNMPGGMSEKLARAAAQQRAIREQMQKFADQMMDESGQVSGNMKQTLKNMEQNETDMVNKRITQATINRQKDIVTRLLQSENAELQREKDDQRKSDEAKNQKYSNPEDLFQYKKDKEKELEMLRTIPPALNPFFRSKVNDYFYRVKE